jgi:hypothetical protein
LRFRGYTRHRMRQDEIPEGAAVNRTTFVKVIVLEVAIVVALWFLGRMFS